MMAYVNARFSLKGAGSNRTWQRGQALTEALVMFVVLLSLWSAVTWLGRYQDIALQASHASRYTAFDLARGQSISAPEIQRQFFAQPNHQWADRAGRKLFNDPANFLQAELASLDALPGYAQPGQNAQYAATLRQEWQLADAGVHDARVQMKFASKAQPARAGTFMSGLRDFDHAYPSLQRHTAILVDAGHAADDAQVQARVAHGALAWSTAADNSYGLRNQINSPMQAVDAGWNRPAPSAEWLTDWAGDIPKQHRFNFWGQP